MKPKIHSFTVRDSAGVLDALKKISDNHRGFLIVLARDETVLGTLTDGDIRRALIAGKTVESPVGEICQRQFAFLDAADERGVLAAIDIFKDNKFVFLPILDGGGLVNLITKQQLHALLLQDIRADLSYDFFSLEESVVDYEIFQRPWGFFKTTVLNQYYQSKVISVSPGAKLSLQAHRFREEYWIVVHGTGVAQLGGSTIELRCGSSLFIPKDCKHRVTNTSGQETLIIAETQIGEYLGEDDIIRYEDAYGRI